MARDDDDDNDDDDDDDDADDDDGEGLVLSREAGSVPRNSKGITWE